MRQDESYGVVPFRRVDKNWQVLLVHRNEGFWEFPKGHAEEGEDQLASATRELNEESGLTIKRLLLPNPIPMSYYFSWEGKRIHKTVFYFLAEVEGTENIQIEEVQGFRWVDVESASDLLTYPSSKNHFKEVLEVIKSL
jgi:8-oxo-dGTP pyrophosphatase MutT (NUDIX family)